ncbi:MAG TPA: FAD-containing monooxygenase EthA, partial [Alphaproteobacteria bacterium]|nr:FAD-containing monooxygenase EthA [Alphaproteobacteria bacterium]
MLQRSPTYMVSRPAEDAQANWLRRNLPSMLAYQLVRWRNVLLQSYFFNLVRRYPAWAKERLINELKPLLPANYDVATHLTPKYNPWDQRLCLVPDADMFKAISAGKASIVTDQIESFTESGVKLKSGAEIKADIIVTATGLDLTTLGGADVVVDGKAVRWPDTLIYKGMMYSDVPNLVNAFGYTNASWTLKADLTSEYFCRMLNYLDREGYAQFTPRTHGEDVETVPFVDFSSGYFQRALERLPKQGAKAPWRLYQNYFVDLLNLRFGSLNTKEMEFKRRLAARRASNVVPIRDAAE